MTKQRFLGPLSVIASLISGAAANAVPVTYDFTGSGAHQIFTGVGSESTHPPQTYTGWVTIDVIAPGPSGTDSYSDFVTASDYHGWVQSDFFIDWGSGSFNPSPMPELVDSDMLARVFNSQDYDSLSNREFYHGAAGDTNHYSFAELSRDTTTDLTWLSDLSFNQSVELAPGSNFITFGDYSLTPNSAGTDHDAVGYFGVFHLSSFTHRVPEPGTIALFALGLAGLGMARRRAVCRADPDVGGSRNGAPGRSLIRPKLAALSGSSKAEICCYPQTYPHKASRP